MHTLLTLSSLLLVLLGSTVALVILQRFAGWAQRRDLQFGILAAPIVSLAVGLGGLAHFVGRACFMTAPAWDYILGVALPLGMGLLALVGLGLGLARLALMAWVVARRGHLADAALQNTANTLAKRLGAPHARVRLCAYHAPLALTCGLWRPTIVLSTWMLTQLDAHELEAVLAHELSHVTRRDYLVTWLATVLRDSFWYLPTSWAAYHQLQQEKELACDDLAVSATSRPLALASALAKVWQHAVARPDFGLAQHLGNANGLMEGRITRLLAAAQPANSAAQPRLVALGVGAAALAALLALQMLNLTVMLAPMGCGPGAPLWRLLS
jgi:Zn-dependent protease with chaperone function